MSTHTVVYQLTDAGEFEFQVDDEVEVLSCREWGEMKATALRFLDHRGVDVDSEDVELHLEKGSPRSDG